MPITSTCRSTKTSIAASWRRLLAGEKTDFKEWEKSTPYFEACLPIEVMAARGVDTLRFGPMKPVGLSDPRTAARPHAVVQLRQDNKLGSLWNMVGFQTKLKHGEQVRIFRTIPGLEKAEFARLGGLHRNTFINSPRLLDAQLRLKAAAPPLRRTGNGRGRLCRKRGGRSAGGTVRGRRARGWRSAPPPTTALGALLAHITGGHVGRSGQDGASHPMNIRVQSVSPIAEAAPRWKTARARPSSRAKKRSPRPRARRISAYG